MVAIARPPWPFTKCDFENLIEPSGASRRGDETSPFALHLSDAKAVTINRCSARPVNTPDRVQASWNHQHDLGAGL